MTKLTYLLAIALMAAPTLSHAAMNGANTVNSAAIVDGSIATADLANKAVTGAKIADATITATQLAAGAVTDAKISGTISTAKLPIGTTGSSVAAGNHSHDTIYAKKYANVVTVAKSGGDYTSPIAALAAITTASATNPYLVKVMPGIYDLGTASLQMKAYVDVEGSGPEVTTITSSNSNVDGGTCTVGTVLMANNMAVRNIKIENRAPNLGGAYTSIAALVFNNVAAKAENVSVLTGSNSTIGAQNNGVCTYGTLADAVLNNMDIVTRNNGGQSNPIEFMGGKITLTNSRLAAFNTEGGDVDIINNNYWNPDNPGTITVSNSVLEGTGCPTCAVHGLTPDDGAFVATVSNTTITMNGQLCIMGGYPGIFMDNSKIKCNGGTVSYGINPAKTSIVNSQLPNDRTALTGAVLTNCYDEKYRPIPNQP